MTDTIDLTGQVALVTGAGVALGRAYAIALAERGATVWVNDLHPHGRPDAASETATVDVITAAGGKAVWLQGDVSDPSQAEAMIARVIAESGRLDILVNNAGVNLAKPFGETGMAEFERVIRVHLMGTVQMTRAAWPHMVRQNYGRVVVTTSSSILGSPWQAAYSAAKMGTWGFMTATGLEGEQFGIRVNAIAPCADGKDMEAAFIPEFRAAMDPAIVAQAIVFLASRDAPQRGVLYAGGGGYSTLRVVDSGGLFLGPEARAEAIRDRHAEIAAMHAPREFGDTAEHISRFNSAMGVPGNIWQPGIAG